MHRQAKLLLQVTPLVFFPVILLIVGLFLCVFPHEFRIRDISSDLPFRRDWEVENLDLELEHKLLFGPLDQRFRYMSRTEEWYGFISEDDRYIIKFFRMDRLTPKTGLTGFFAALFEGSPFDHGAKKQQMLDELFGSIKIFYEELKDMTTLLYIHLNKTRRLKKKIEIIDKERRCFLVDLDSTEFVFERKAAPLYPSLINLYDGRHEEDLRGVIRSIFSSVMRRCLKGYGEKDHRMGDHYGLIGGQLVLFDLGLLVAQEDLAFSYNAAREVEVMAERLCVWMGEHCPGIVPIIHEELAPFLNP